MTRRSTISRLPKTLVDRCHELIRDGHTIDEILDALNGMGAEVSRSSLGRYVKSARESMEKYRQAQEVAKVWVDKLEAEPEGDVSRLLPEMLRVVAFQTLTTMGEGEDPVKSMDIMLLAKALRDISQTTKANIDIERQLRGMRSDLKKAATEVEQTARAAGLSPDTINSIKARILGVGNQA